MVSLKNFYDFMVAIASARTTLGSLWKDKKIQGTFISTKVLINIAKIDDNFNEWAWISMLKVYTGVESITLAHDVA